MWVQVALQQKLIQRVNSLRLHPTGFIWCLVTLLLVVIAFSSKASLFVSSIDDRCQIYKTLVSFNERIFQNCDKEVNACIEQRVSSHLEPFEQARDHCWKRPLRIDSRFVGPCPDYLEKLESSESEVPPLELVSIRNYFQLRPSPGYDNDLFKRTESEKIVKDFLSSNPDDVLGFEHKRWLSLFSHDKVERLELDLKYRELDPDCPSFLMVESNSLFVQTNVIVDNWLAGQGSGAELTDIEMRDLLVRVQRTLIHVYDFLIKEDVSESRVSLAHQSVHDAVLTRSVKNLQEIASRVDLGPTDYAEERRNHLIQKFSSEYNVNSDHGRTKTLKFMCNHDAFELGLFEHCFKLLNHFAQQDFVLNQPPLRDWTRAAIEVASGLSRDCSEHSEFWGWVPAWWNERLCLAEQYPTHQQKLQELVQHFSATETEMSAEKEVLDAYLHLDESSDDRFLRAIHRDRTMASYAAPLSKRLHQVGQVNAALNILNRIDEEIENQLNEDEKEFLNKVSSSLNERNYQNWAESPIDFQHPGIRL